MFLTGCSSVYTVKYFSSKQEFYQNFNDFAMDKNVKIYFTNDSVLNSLGAIIADDTLYSLGYAVQNQYMVFPTSEVKEIKYNNSNYKNGIIVLKNGRKFQTTGMDYSIDTVKFYTDYNVTGKNIVAAIRNVKEVRYYNKWANMGTKVISGTIGGMIGGFALGTKIDEHVYYQQQGEAPFTGCLLGMPVGAFIGFIIGLYTGYNYIYLFNQ
jgi:hypothetical protein